MDRVCIGNVSRSKFMLPIQPVVYITPRLFWIFNEIVAVVICRVICRVAPLLWNVYVTLVGFGSTPWRHCLCHTAHQDCLRYTAYLNNRAYICFSGINVSSVIWCPRSTTKTQGVAIINDHETKIILLCGDPREGNLTTANLRNIVYSRSALINKLGRYPTKTFTNPAVAHLFAGFNSALIRYCFILFLSISTLLALT